MTTIIRDLHGQKVICRHDVVFIFIRQLLHRRRLRSHFHRKLAGSSSPCFTGLSLDLPNYGNSFSGVRTRGRGGEPASQRSSSFWEGKGEDAAVMETNNEQCTVAANEGSKWAHLVPMWFSITLLAPHFPAHAPASGGVECPRSFALAAITASGPRDAKRGSMSCGMCASVASCTRSDKRPGVEETSAVSAALDDVSPRMANFRGAGSEAGSWMIKPIQGSTSQPTRSSGSNVEQWYGQTGRHRPRWTSGPAHTFTAPLKLRPSVKFRQYPSSSQRKSRPGSSWPWRASSSQGVRGSVGMRSS